MRREPSARLSGLMLLAFAAGLTACGPSDLLGPEAEQGIDGIALRGPMCPVQSLENPCPDEPYVTLLAIRKEGGALVTTVQTGQDGRFRVGLRPGRYIVDPGASDRRGPVFPWASEQDVDVEVGAFASVTVSFDTGIR